MWVRNMSWGLLQRICRVDDACEPVDVIAWGETSMTLLGGVVLESDSSCQ